MQITTQGFKAAAAKLQGMGNAFESAKFQRVLIDALEPIRRGAISKVHSVSGRTARAIVVEAGKGRRLSAHVKIDRRIASEMWRRRPFPYPIAVERGHGGPRPAQPHPFFIPAVEENRATVRRIVNAGAQEVLNPYIYSSAIGGEFS